MDELNQKKRTIIEDKELKLGIIAIVLLAFIMIMLILTGWIQ